MTPNKEINALKSTKVASFVTLFTSSGTIICCAIPALLVSIGAGASLSSLISSFPQLVILSVYKIPIFIAALMVLLISGVVQYRARQLPCPVDKSLADLCRQTRKVSLIIYLVSLGIFIIGTLITFIIPLLFNSR